MTIYEAYNQTKRKLENAGIEDFVYESKIIIKHITGFSSSQILTEYNNELTESQKRSLTEIVNQRERRYPLQYILGEWSFYKYKFKVGEGVLIPRNDTEILVEKCCEYLQDKANPEIIDLCAGSGCIGISLACDFPKSRVVLLEKYPRAEKYLQQNVQLNGALNTVIIKGDVFKGTANNQLYDLIVSNPPYIPLCEMAITSPETKFEPENALLGGKDGLDFYRVIIENYKNSLKAGGMMAFEVGINEAGYVSQIFKNSGFANIKIFKDLNLIERVVTAIKE